jgi:acyl-CoA synthetase (AMP-forming)/AMP-acid ligase II
VVAAPAPVIGEIGVAFVVPATVADDATADDATADDATAEELRMWCRERIADYKVPDLVVFMDDLPVNATYKVDVTRLRQLAAESAARRPRVSRRR